VRGGEWLLEDTEAELTRLQRRTSASLSPRERLIFEAFADGAPDYAGTWYRAARFQLICALVVITLAALGFSRFARLVTAFGLLQLLSILPLGSLFSRMNQMAGAMPGSTKLGHWLPVSLSEIPAVERKLGWPFWVVALPWWTLVGALAAVPLGFPLEAGAVIGVKAFVFAVVSRPFFRDTAYIEGKGCFRLIGCLLGLAVVGGCGMALVMAPPEWALVALAGVWLAATLTWRRHVRSWPASDVVTP
jgi:hypothetical protein